MSSTEFELQRPPSIATKPKSSKIKVKPAMTTYRIMIAYRFLLAAVGGYVLASLSAIVIAQYFAEYQSSAAMAATLIAFSVSCAAFIWVFMVNKALKASLGIIIPSLILFVCYKVMGN